MNDLVFFKSGQNYDWIEMSPESDYIVDVLEPFLDLGIGKENPLVKKRLEFADKEGKVYTDSVANIVKNGLKIYYHDSPRSIDLEKVPGIRREGMLVGLLDEVDIFVAQNKIA